MRIIYLERLNEFGKRHAHARKSIAAWKAVVEAAYWNKKQDVLADFKSENDKEQPCPV